MGIPSALDVARERVALPRLGKSLWREMDHDIIALRDLIAEHEAVVRDRDYMIVNAEGLARSGDALKARAEAAEARLAELTLDDAVERACAGFYNDPDGLAQWHRLVSADPRLAEKYRAGMRAALAAALGEGET